MAADNAGMEILFQQTKTYFAIKSKNTLN